MRVGDKHHPAELALPDNGFFNEKQIPDSGDINLPLLTQSFHAAGRNTAEIAADITETYKSQKIYTNPVVAVLSEEQFIIVGGDVRGPTNVVWRPDSTLMSTINACGGFTEFANRRAVRILRGQQVIEVDCIKAINTPGADPPVYPGDQILFPAPCFKQRRGGSCDVSSTIVRVFTKAYVLFSWTCPAAAGVNPRPSWAILGVSSCSRNGDKLKRAGPGHARF